ncbi:MAG: HIT family protein [Myxococcales bacterium]
MACVFCEIVAGRIAGAKVYEDAQVLAFLDHAPLFPGHVLLVPKAHHETLPDLPPELVQPLFAVAQRLASAVVAALGCEGTFVAMNNRVSQSVPHLHVHIVPRRKRDGLKGFFWPRHPYRDDAHREQVRAAIAASASRPTAMPG